jgi:hypothetical protein
MHKLFIIIVAQRSQQDWISVGAAKANGRILVRLLQTVKQRNIYKKEGSYRRKIKINWQFNKNN